MSRVIDFRVRPPFGAYQSFVNSITPESLAAFGFGSYEYRGSLASKRYDDFVTELDAANVTKAVIPGRHGAFGSYVDNKELFELVRKDPGRYVAFPFIEALDADAPDQVDRLIVNGPGTGAVIEPGIPTSTNPSFSFDDRRAYPLYATLEANRIPLMITYSAHALDHFDADSTRQLDQVAVDFPNLTIVVAHGGWPWTSESIAIAWHRPNVYLSPDIYATSGPSAEDYKVAARTVLQDKLIFNSAYPGSPVDQAVELVRRTWNLTERQLEKVLYSNAARILGL